MEDSGIAMSSNASNDSLCGPKTKRDKLGPLTMSQKSLLERNIKARSMAFLPTNSNAAVTPVIPAVLLQDTQIPGKISEAPIFQPPPACLDDNVVSGVTTRFCYIFFFCL